MSTAVLPVNALPPPPVSTGDDVLNGSEAVFDLLPLGICICDQNAVIRRHNAAAAGLWGRVPMPAEPAERFWQLCGLRAQGGSGATQPPRLLDDVLSTGRPVRDREVILTRPDGSSVVLRVNTDAIRDAANAIVGAVICFRDITEFHDLRAARREGERQSHALLEALPIAVYTTDAKGKIDFYNQAAVDLWGREPNLGEDAWCGSLRLYTPDGRPMAHAESPLSVAMTTGEPIRGAEVVAERPDGTRIPFLAYPTPMRDESGTLIGAVNTLVEISERKHGEELAQQLKSIIESSDDAIFSKDLNSVITSWNAGAERLFGYTAAEMVGRPVTTLIPADRDDEEQGILARIRRGERVDQYETVRLRQDGSLIEVSLSVSPVKNADGRIIGASAIAWDIAERRRAQERQILLLREMRHRVKNLFALAVGVATLSARFVQTPEDMARAVRERLSALSRAHDLTLPDLADSTEGPAKDTTLRVLIQTIASPYVYPLDDGEGPIAIRGPDVTVGGSAVTSLALLLHEFAVNAAKFGALSLPTGRVDIDWHVTRDELRLTWQEHGGPALSDLARTEGFGTLLARATVKGQLGGSIERDWAPEGLRIHLAVSLARLAR